MRRSLHALGLVLAVLGGVGASPLPPAPVREVPQVAAPQPRDWPVPQVLTLSSGAPVQVLARHQVPLVRLEVSFPWAGVDADLPDQLAAAMMGQQLRARTRLHSGAELAAAMDRLGAQWAVGATLSRLWADVEVPRGAEAEAVALLAEVLLDNVPDRAEGKRLVERWVTWQEGMELDLVRIHDRGVNHAWFPPGHPSRHQATVRDLERLGARKVEALRRRIIGQTTPRFAVTGDVDPAQLLPLLEQHFGHLSGPVVPGTGPAAPHERAAWLVHRPGFDVARLSWVMPGPAAGDPQAPVAELLWAVLATEFTSRVPMDLRETRGLAYSVSGRARSWRGDGWLRIDAEVDAERTVEALLAVEAHLDRVLDEGPTGFTEVELERARNTLLIRAERRLETLRSATDTLGEQAILDRTLADLRAEAERTQQATADDLHHAAEQWLVTSSRAWVLTGDRALLEPALEAADRVPDHIVDHGTLAAEP